MDNCMRGLKKGVRLKIYVFQAVNFLVPVDASPDHQLEWLKKVNGVDSSASCPCNTEIWQEHEK